MPLSFADLNSVNTIKKIGGSKEQQRHLENLGFVPGTVIVVGASAVAVGTANFNDPYTTIKVIDGIREYMEKNNVADIKELIGCVR